MNDVETANDARRRKALIGAIRDALAPGRNLAEGVGSALGVVVAEVQRSAERIAELEKQLAGQQKRIDHADVHVLKFAGEWTHERGFYAGHIVRHAGHAYTCLRNTPPGGQPPNRHGSPWALIV